MHLSRQYNCWSLRCSWRIACRRCSNYIFILGRTHGFNGLDKDNWRTRRDSLTFWVLVHFCTKCFMASPTCSAMYLFFKDAPIIVLLYIRTTYHCAPSYLSWFACKPLPWTRSEWLTYLHLYEINIVVPCNNQLSSVNESGLSCNPKAFQLRGIRCWGYNYKKRWYLSILKIISIIGETFSNEVLFFNWAYPVASKSHV